MAPESGGRPRGAAAILFNRQVAVSVGLATLTGAVVYFYRGPDVFWRALHDDAALILRVLPTAVGSVFLAAFVRVLVPRDVVRHWLGEGSGMTGLLIAAAIAIVVPGGPITSYPLIVALIAAGADIGVTMAFVTSWSVLGLTRIIVWELPLLGWRFAVIRFVASLALPVLAGLLARRLPNRIVLPQQAGR
jgi:uncharacterized membrane protein YraQ (UPF0718 family)